MMNFDFFRCTHAAVVYADPADFPPPVLVTRFILVQAGAYEKVTAQEMPFAFQGEDFEVADNLLHQIRALNFEKRTLSLDLKIDGKHIEIFCTLISK